MLDFISSGRGSSYWGYVPVGRTLLVFAMVGNKSSHFLQKPSSPQVYNLWTCAKEASYGAFVNGHFKKWYRSQSATAPFILFALFWFMVTCFSCYDSDTLEILLFEFFTYKIHANFSIHKSSGSSHVCNTSHSFTLLPTMFYDVLAALDSLPVVALSNTKLPYLVLIF